MISSAFNFLGDYVTQPVITTVKDYIARPIISAVNDYIVQPGISWATRKATEVGTKEASKMGTKMASRLVITEEGNTEQQADFNSRVIHAVQTAPANAKNWSESKAMEAALDFGLKCADAVVTSPTVKVAKRVAPKALFQYNRHKEKNLPLGRLVVSAATGHAVGTLAQEAVDSTLPQIAPIGGYVAYGMTSVATELGCQYLYDRANNTLEAACDAVSEYIVGDIGKLSI